MRIGQSPIGPRLDIAAIAEGDDTNPLYARSIQYTSTCCPQFTRPPSSPSYRQPTALNSPLQAGAQWRLPSWLPTADPCTRYPSHNGPLTVPYSPKSSFLSFSTSVNSASTLPNSSASLFCSYPSSVGDGSTAPSPGPRTVTGDYVGPITSLRVVQRGARRLPDLPCLTRSDRYHRAIRSDVHRPYHGCPALNHQPGGTGRQGADD